MVFLVAVLPRGAMKYSEYSHYIAAVLSFLIAAALCFRAIRSGLLASPAIGWPALLLAFVKSLAWSYLKLAVLIGLVFLVTFAVAGVSYKDAGFLSALFALWLALWLAPAMASLATGRKLSASAENGV